MPHLQADGRFQGVLGSDYDLLKMAMPHYDALQDAIAQEVVTLGDFKDQTAIGVLEIGCGTGITTKVLLDVDSRMYVYALDNEEVMIAQCRENIKKWGDEKRVEYIHDDVLRYLKSVPDNHYDAVASSMVLHNFKNTFRHDVIREIYRVLKKGGVFVNGDKYAYEDTVEHKKIYNMHIKRYDIFDTIGKSDLREAWVKHYAEDERLEVIFKEKEAISFLEEVGFTAVQKTYREMLEAVIVGKK